MTSNSINKIAVVSTIIIVLVALGLSMTGLKTKNETLILSSYEECINHPDSRILESFPERCITKDGQSFTRELSEDERKNMLPPDNTIPSIIEPEISPDTANEKCKISGCNGEICQNLTDEDMMSICVYKDEFACYKNASCEVQTDGNCGWTESEELNNCFRNYNSNINE